jgi:hypothetical protein
MPDMGSAVADVRTSCAEVAAGARSVHLVERRLSSYAAELSPVATRTGTGEHPAVVLARDVIEFGSGWHPVLEKPSGRSGSQAISDGFARHVAEHGPPTAAWLRSASASRCAELFGQPLDGPAHELLERFAWAWRALGEDLDRRWGGEAWRLVDAADGSAVRLVDLLLEFGVHWDDWRWWRGRRISFHKRAQLAAADLGLGQVEQLTAFADNLVPHVLRLDGLLEWDEDLVRRVETGELLAQGEEPEVELRAVAVRAVDRLAHLTGASPADLDVVLWERGHGARYKAVPRPRCRTTSY